jgi:predicted permease
VGALAHRARAESEMDAEMQFHLEARTADLMREGLPREEARRRARVEFGGVERAKQECRDARGITLAENLAQDLRFGLRMLRKNPGFTAVAVLTLALGIGANTAIFSIVNAVMLSSLPIHDAGSLLVLQWSANHEHNGGTSSYGDCDQNRGGGRLTDCSLSYPMFKEVKAQANLFSGVAAFAGPETLIVGGNGQASMAHGELVSGDYFSTLGVVPELGRVLEPVDESPAAEAVAVLSYPYWQSAFGGSPSVLGRTIRLNGMPVRVVGVADRNFTRLTPGQNLDMWLPLTLTSGKRLKIDWGNNFLDPAQWWLTTVARLRSGVNRRQAEAALTVLFRNAVLSTEKPQMKPDDDPHLELVPAQRGLMGIRSTLGTPLYILMGAVGMVLLISCANVAGLLLARARAREKEMTMRAALGAGQARMLRQLLTESVLLATAGGLLGIFLAYWLAGSLAAFVSSNSEAQIVGNAGVNAGVLVFTALTSVLCGILFGLAPALWSARSNTGAALKDNATQVTGPHSGGPGGWRVGLGGVLVIGQVALSVVVLIGAGLLVRTLANLKGMNPGFETRNLLHFGVNPDLSGYEKERVQNLYDEMQRRLAALPGVLSVSCASEVLLNGGLWSTDVHVEGAPKDSRANTSMLAVSEGYFETMGIGLLTGRAFTASDLHSKQDVAIVNQSFVRQYLQGRNPIGLHLQGGSDDNPENREIVGVLADAKYATLRREVEPTTYVPLRTGPAYFELRTGPKPEALMPAVRKLLGDLDEDLPVYGMRSETETIDRLLFNERLVARLSSLFGVLALLLAGVGLLGLLSYEVARRSGEIGVRMALGARPEGVVWLVLRRGLFLVATGTAAGILVAAWLTRYLGSLLYGVPNTDPLTFAAVTCALLTVALLACWIPAWRATRVEPMVALRHE